MSVEVSDSRTPNDPLRPYELTQTTSASIAVCADII